MENERLSFKLSACQQQNLKLEEINKGLANALYDLSKGNYSTTQRDLITVNLDYHNGILSNISKLEAELVEARKLLDRVKYELWKIRDNTGLKLASGLGDQYQGLPGFVRATDRVIEIIEAYRQLREGK